VTSNSQINSFRQVTIFSLTCSEGGRPRPDQEHWCTIGAKGSISTPEISVESVSNPFPQEVRKP
jgi:hypothetical protein